MSRVGTLGDPNPYEYFGTFAGLPMWPGGMTLLSAAPGIGKTSWLLRMVMEAAAGRFPAALGCYEHTAQELKYRVRKQAEAALSGAHGKPETRQVETLLARSSEAVLLSLSPRDDTIRAVEEVLIKDYRFPEQGPAVVCLDYLSRIPVIGLTGMLAENERIGQAAVELKSLARKHGWAVIVAAAVKKETFDRSGDLAALAGNEDVPYEADRVLFMRRLGIPKDCGCVDVLVETEKDRTGPIRNYPLMFWGERFYPAMPDEFARHGEAA